MHPSRRGPTGDPAGRLGRRRPSQAIARTRFIDATLSGHLPHRHVARQHHLRDYDLVSPQPCRRILRAGGHGLRTPSREGAARRQGRQWKVRGFACSGLREFGCTSTRPDAPQEAHAYGVRWIEISDATDRAGFELFALSILLPPFNSP